METSVLWTVAWIFSSCDDKISIPSAETMKVLPQASPTLK